MLSTIQKFLQKNRESRKKIICVGDVMVDEYHDVSVNRISPEFPMPIMKSSSIKNSINKPGGAANVAYQFKNFNVDVQLMCFMDINIRNVLVQYQIPYWWQGNNIGLMGGAVPVKHRFLDKNVQVVRWDVEDDKYFIDSSQIVTLQHQIRKHLSEQDVDVAILSDYDKGFFEGEDNWIDIFKDTITIVDPKEFPLSRWKGCTIFKPNKTEAKKLTGLNDWKAQCVKLTSELSCKSVIITHGDEGVVGCWNHEFFEFMPETKVNAISVVGAGDCFVAGLALAVSHGFEGKEAVEIAYEMGAQYVQHGLNRPIIPAELPRDGIVHPDDLKNRDFRLVFTNGCFDLIHSGHLQTLEFAASKGDKLVVALNDDESIKRLKGESRPVKMLEERMKIMASLKPVDFVVSFSEDTPREILSKILPDVLIKGADYNIKDIVGREFAKETYLSPLVDGKSTTALIT